MMAADDVTLTATGDLAVRKKVRKLASGYYGVVFSGVKFSQVASNLVLNFTMTHPGENQFFDDVSNEGFQRAPAFERAGLGFYDYANRTDEDIWNRQYFANTALESKWNYQLLDAIRPKLYQGYEANQVKLDGNTINGLSCSLIEDPKRQAWCLESGYTSDSSLASGPGVLLSNPFDVTGMVLVRV
jgi:hypothetical protein